MTHTIPNKRRFKVSRLMYPTVTEFKNKLNTQGHSNMSQILERCTGRTTGHCLAIISHSMENIGKAIQIGIDGHSPQTHLWKRETMYVIQKLITKLELDHFYYDTSNITITYDPMVIYEETTGYREVK